MKNEINAPQGPWVVFLGIPDEQAISIFKSREHDQRYKNKYEMYTEIFLSNSYMGVSILSGTATDPHLFRVGSAQNGILQGFCKDPERSQHGIGGGRPGYSWNHVSNLQGTWRRTARNCPWAIYWPNIPKNFPENFPAVRFFRKLLIFQKNVSRIANLKLFIFV